MVVKFPLREDAVVHARVSNTAFASTDGDWKNIIFFVEKFPSLLLKDGDETDAEATDKLQSQWHDFQLADFEPTFSDIDREDEKWAFIGKVKKFAWSSRLQQIGTYHVGDLNTSAQQCCL